MRNEKGSALLALIAAFSIIFVVIMATATLGTRSQTELQWTDDKLELDGLRDYLNSALRDGRLCTMILTQAGPWIASAPATFDESLIGSSTPPAIALNLIPSAPLPAAPALLTLNAALSNRPGLIVRSIEFQIDANLGSAYSGKLLVGFDSTIERKLRPVEIRTTFRAAGPGPKTITSCQTEANQAQGIQTAVFSASGSFTVPSGVTQIKATVIGGGGGGAGGASAENAPGEAACISGGGGGGGGTAICTLTVNSGDIIPATIGTGGAAGNGSGSAGSGPAFNGSDGVSSSFGPACAAEGGRGGRAGTTGVGFAGATGSVGGAGGIGMVGDSLITGTQGSAGRTIPWCGERDLFAETGVGGSSYSGSHIFGGGGSGGHAFGGLGSAGFTGQNGVVILEWIQ